MSTPIELLHKLQVHSGSRLWLVNAPRVLAEELSAGAEVEIVHEADPHDGVLAFFETTAEVAQLADRVLAHLPEDGLVWVAFRRGPAGRAAGLTREAGWTPFQIAGWHPVDQVSIDDEWSALRLSPN